MEKGLLRGGLEARHRVDGHGWFSKTSKGPLGLGLWKRTCMRGGNSLSALSGEWDQGLE